MPDPDEGFGFAIGTLHDARVLVDFGGRLVDHMKLDQQEALDFAEGLVHAVHQAREHGRVIEIPGSPHSG